MKTKPIPDGYESALTGVVEKDLERARQFFLVDTAAGCGITFGYDFVQAGECESAAENFPRDSRRTSWAQPVHHFGAGRKNFTRASAGMEAHDGAGSATGRAAGKGQDGTR